MSACEAEACPFWSGSGCDCAVFGITDAERERQQRSLGIATPAQLAAERDPDPWDECHECGHDRDEHDPHGCHAWSAEGVGGECSCSGFTEEKEVRHRT